MMIMMDCELWLSFLYCERKRKAQCFDRYGRVVTTTRQKTVTLGTMDSSSSADAFFGEFDPVDTRELLAEDQQTPRSRGTNIKKYFKTFDRTLGKPQRNLFGSSFGVYFRWRLVGMEV